MKHDKLIYTAPTYEAIKLEMEGPALTVLSTRQVLLTFALFDDVDTSTGAETITW